MMTFNWVDAVLVLIVLVSAALGWQRGFIFSVLDLVRWLGSWLIALLLYKPFSTWLSFFVNWSDVWRAPLAFIILIFLSGVAIHFVGRAILNFIPGQAHVHPVNRLLGIVPGMISGSITAAIISALLLAMPISDSLSEYAQKSRLNGLFAVFTDELEDVLVPVFNPAINQTLNKLITVEPGSDESVELPFKVENSRPEPSLEAQMLEMINNERTSRGLKPLEADPELVPVARAHSADMFARGYFSHYTPDREDPFQRMKDAGVRFRTAGENLALAPTLQIAHSGLMNSPGHRANILNPAFGRIGIGIMSGGRRGIMVSQEFRN
jgi:uncharacterized protein YkwD